MVFLLVDINIITRVHSKCCRHTDFNFIYESVYYRTLSGKDLLDNTDIPYTEWQRFVREYGHTLSGKDLLDNTDIPCTLSENDLLENTDIPCILSGKDLLENTDIR